jgi:membrane protease YdiL (CAAX protease family)
VWILLVTYGCLKAYWLLSFRLGRMLDAYSAEALLKLVVWGPLCGVVAWLMYRQQAPSADRALGLRPASVNGMLAAAVATLPMAVAALMLPRKPLNPDLVAGSGLIGPFAEELLFRGFLFTLLVRRAGWSVLAALLVSSLMFGLAHWPGSDGVLLYFLKGPQWNAAMSPHFIDRATYWRFGSEVWLAMVRVQMPPLIEQVLPYALGGALFAWITWRWQSLWPAVALHALMNFWWDLTTGEHAQLDFAIDPMSAAQALSAVLAVIVTLRYGKADRYSV